MTFPSRPSSHTRAPRSLPRVEYIEQRYYRWRRECGGLKVTQAARLKALEKENARLRKAVSNLALDALILKEVIEGKFQPPLAGTKMDIKVDSNPISEKIISYQWPLAEREGFEPSIRF